MVQTAPLACLLISAPSSWAPALSSPPPGSQFPDFTPRFSQSCKDADLCLAEALTQHLLCKLKDSHSVLATLTGAVAPNSACYILALPKWHTDSLFGVKRVSYLVGVCQNVGCRSLSFSSRHSKMLGRCHQHLPTVVSGICLDIFRDRKCCLQQLQLQGQDNSPILGIIRATPWVLNFSFAVLPRWK